MCTVSFVFANEKVIITSNRDEKIVRPQAIEPKNYLINNKNIIFPKDKKAGGTWFAIDENANVVVLLNGAAEKHIVKNNYLKSRGLIVLELISSFSAILSWKSINLDEVEPFTLVVFQDKKLYQLRWNGFVKETTELDSSQNHIWSSSTLYSSEIRAKRANWFENFLDTKPVITPNEMFNFHRYTEENNQEHGLVINRDDVTKTVSITQTVIEKNKVEIFYHDLISEQNFSNSFITV
ncbi:NRDE family protein [Flavobacterium sp. SUN052]|uniref:NRDE family protein n=1 Tax=Flavobacterium sp. SUN052 TaxID=3002441 RepID=UPI00237E0E12|nr:NRDE family protein [Flavobacterium sp. SUN052]MEC4004545.1 NRDE family protein [Flavobacterium sp. SUN052]